MKKLSLLVFSAVLLAIAGCTKENTSEVLDFAGIKVEVGEIAGAKGLYILNEGAFPGASTLDYLDFTTKQYYADVFGQANPTVAQGLGNTGNDMALAGGRHWLMMNASNQVVVLDVPTCKLVASVDVESPRHIAVEGNYVYVSSYGAAVYGSETQVEGKLYRIGINDFSVSFVTVGYQPEGVAVLGGKVYVANSGGYNWVHDNRISVVDIASFKLEKQIELPFANLNLLFSDGENLWVNSYGESSWTQDAGGNWIQSVSAPQALAKVTPAGVVTVIEDVHSRIMDFNGKDIYTIGDAAEMEGGGQMCLYVVDKSGSIVSQTALSTSEIAYPYGIAVTSGGEYFISDASFTGGSKVNFYGKNSAHWSLDSGVGTGKLLIR